MSSEITMISVMTVKMTMMMMRVVVGMLLLLLMMVTVVIVVIVTRLLQVGTSTRRPERI